MFQKKTCSRCGKEATHKFTRVKDGQVIDIHLCMEHAMEESKYQSTPQQLSDILQGLLNQQELGEKPGTPPAPAGLRCSLCRLPFEAYRRNLLLGCSECYTSFRKFLLLDLRKFHGGTRHVGRRPVGAPGPTREPLQGEIEAAPEEISPTLLSPSVMPHPTPKTPSSAERLVDLEKGLQQSIRDQNYMKAAEFRDQIRELKLRMESQAKPQP